MRVGLWVAQVVLAVAFAFAGQLHLLTPIPALVGQAAWAGAVPVTLARFIGAAEIVGALGLLLPALTRIRPSLTPMAAGGLATIMVLATVVHLVRGEMSLVPVNLVLGGLAVFVWWGRTKKAPILPKT